MANDWIKVEILTPDKPEMRRAARECGVSVAEAFLGWFRLWSYFDHATDCGFVPRWTHEDCDAISHVVGLAASFEASGWLIFDASGCTIINWDRHNGNSGKARSQANRRQGLYRSKRNIAEAQNGRHPTHR